MEKLDLKQTYKHLYRAAKSPSVVDVPTFNFLMIDGHGDPNTAQLYKDAVEALFSLSYALKFAIKKGLQAVDYAVMPLEGLWWTDEPQVNLADKSQWHWRMMIAQPDLVTAELVEQVRTEVVKKKGLAQLANLRFEQFHEGECVQILHLGSYSAEAPTIATLHQYITDNGYNFRGLHHEIYLKDPARSAAEKLETIIRQPIQR